MKRKLLTLATMCATSLSALSTPAFAFTDGTAEITDPTLHGITDAAAQAVCTTLAANHGSAWTGTFETGSITGEITSGPTADGARDIDQSSVVGSGDQVPESVQVHGDPFRIGGSVNMFGFARVVAAHWTDSEYDFTQPFTWGATYTFTCNMSEHVLVPATGHHSWNHDPSDAEDAQQNACDAHDAAGKFIGQDIGHCYWIVDVAAHYEDQDRDDETGTIGPVTEGDTLAGHELHGGSVPVDPEDVDLPDVQVVVCISPNTNSKKTLPGSGWAAKNGYDGSNCTTAWYNGGAKAQPSPYDNLNTGSNNIVTIPTV